MRGLTEVVILRSLFVLLALLLGLGRRSSTPDNPSPIQPDSGMEDLVLRMRRLLRANPSARPEQVACALGLEESFVREAMANLGPGAGRSPSPAWRQPSLWARAARRGSFVLGTGLVTLGAILLLAVGAVYGYGAYEQLRFEQELARTPVPSLPVSAASAEEVTPTPVAMLSPGAAPNPRAPAARGEPVGASTWPTPDPTPTPVVLPAQRVIIPKIKLDSRVVESPIKDGQWQVPKFVAGHLEGTAHPGQVGNAVLSGHVESIASGNVFANLDKVEIGDRITVVSPVAAYEYVVQEKKVVKNTDLSVVQPTPDETLTLITCTGVFIPATRDYDRRLILVAKRASDTLPRGLRTPGG